MKNKYHHWKLYQVASFLYFLRKFNILYQVYVWRFLSTPGPTHLSVNLFNNKHTVQSHPSAHLRLCEFITVKSLNQNREKQISEFFPSCVNAILNKKEIHLRLLRLCTYRPPFFFLTVGKSKKVLYFCQPRRDRTPGIDEAGTTEPFAHSHGPWL